MADKVKKEVVKTAAQLAREAAVARYVEYAKGILDEPKPSGNKSVDASRRVIRATKARNRKDQNPT
jgi:DNA replication protein DnaD